jgi:hypothetical protein
VRLCNQTATSYMTQLNSSESDRRNRLSSALKPSEFGAPLFGIPRTRLWRSNCGATSAAHRRAHRQATARDRAAARPSEALFGAATGCGVMIMAMMANPLAMVRIPFNSPRLSSCLVRLTPLLGLPL